MIKNTSFFLCIIGLIIPNTGYSEESAPSTSAIHGLELIAPSDRFVVRIELRNNEFNQTFDDNGNKQALGYTLDNISLDSAVLPALAAFGANASLGTTLFKTHVKTERVEFTLGYGLSEDLTIGIIIPFGKVTTHASFAIEGGNIGFNPTFNPNEPSSAVNPALLPVGFGPTEAVGTEGVQNILSNPSFGLAYKPIKTTTWEGMGDPIIGALWRPYKTSVDSLIIGGGIRFGMADDVDSDDLLQSPLDDGNTDLKARIEYYRSLNHGFDLKLVADYTYQLEDTVTRRIAIGDAILATADSKESLDRKLGNFREFDIGIGKVVNDWRFSATLHHYAKSADQYKSSINTNTSALEKNTGLYANQWRASISWSGINAWQKKIIPLPLIVQLEIQKTYEAKNFPKVDDIYLQVTSFF